MPSEWPWMLFKVAGGTILCQAGSPQSDGSFPVMRLTEMKIVDPRKAIYDKAASDVMEVMSAKIFNPRDGEKNEKRAMQIKAKADQDAARAIEAARSAPSVYEAASDPITFFLAEPIKLNSSQIVWSAPANESTAKLCREFWAAKTERDATLKLVQQ